MGLYKSARELVGWPITPGFEVAGTVVAVGSEVHDLGVGEDVIGVTRFGGYASDVVLPRWQVFERPRGWTAVEAAGFPTIHLTAYYALKILASPRPGSVILVHSAAGGVGGALVRMGRHLGCRVIGIVGAPHKVEVAREHGAHVVIDASREDLWHRVDWHAPAGFDAVFDANGVSTLAESYKRVAPTGRLVIYGFASMLPRSGRRIRWWRLIWDWLWTPRFSPLALTNKNRSVMAFNLSYLFDRPALLHECMRQCLDWAHAGVLTPPPPMVVFPLARAADAHRALESGNTGGKLVLTPRDADA
jgi:NADPH:quinone reductase-like Zn-dependent oxidoreductase